MPERSEPDVVEQLESAFSQPKTDVVTRRIASVTAKRQTNYQAAISAERIVCRKYLRAGARFGAHRWHGPGGEIDLIFTEGARVVFVEVKKSKTHCAALERVTQRQLARIRASAEAYLGDCPNGALTEMRIDVASVDANGTVQIVHDVGMAASF